MGAVVEIQFELLHFLIGSKKKHSFNTSIQQIQILQPGEERPPTAFKRKTMEEGPIQLDDPSDSSNRDDDDSSIAHKRQRGTNT